MSKKENYVAIVISAVFSWSFLINSPLHPWIQGATYTDSSVFRTVVLMMQNGYMPYRDSFDHKGPLLYWIDYFGVCLNKNWGIWFIELLFLAITFFYLYKVARLCCDKGAAICTVLLAISLLFKYFEWGNFTEEYAMLFIAVSLYIFLNYLVNGYLSYVLVGIAGLCFGAVLMLRPNMVAVWVVFCCYIFIDSVVKKEYKKIGQIVLAFVIGMAVIIVPIVIWLYINGDLACFWETYIGFNSKYSSPSSLYFRYSAAVYFINTIPSLIGICSLLYCIFLRKSWKLNVIYLVYLLVNIVFVSLSGCAFGHYGMVLIPALAYPISLLFSEIESIELKQAKIALKMIVIIITLSSYVLSDWLTISNDIISAYDTKDEKEVDKDEVLNAVVSTVSQYTNENDKISVYGNWNIVYLLSNRLHATRYSYQFPIGTVAPEILDDYYKQLEEQKPKVIVIQTYYNDERMNDFVYSHGYNLIWADESDAPQAYVFSR